VFDDENYALTYASGGLKNSRKFKVKGKIGRKMRKGKRNKEHGA